MWKPRIGAELVVVVVVVMVIGMAVVSERIEMITQTYACLRRKFPINESLQEHTASRKRKERGRIPKDKTSFVRYKLRAYMTNKTVSTCLYINPKSAVQQHSKYTAKFNGYNKQNKLYIFCHGSTICKRRQRPSVLPPRPTLEKAILYPLTSSPTSA
ncbi:hypothetical protein C1H46_024391 [Malus baccata]|uniref:Uncharacterized protein n=1 Tax=Malus baccata TaxID=106549 RepID=A0A540LUJ6_MALBA|nr:hypothetical protein C1H46_024391 [Malus baccata]